MEEELKKLQNEIDELRRQLNKSKQIIDERINNRMDTLEKENGDIYSDEEIVNLNLGLQRIEKEVDNRVKNLMSQIEEIEDFENGKKIKIEDINKKINNKIEKLTQEGYSYSDIYIDDEILNLQSEIEKIKKEKLITKTELNQAKIEYQDLKKEKKKLETQIEEIDKDEITNHLLEEKKQREEEINKLKAKGKNENDPEIKEYLSDIEKINEELEKNISKSKDKKDKLIKIIKDMGKLEEKYGKNKLDEIEKNKDKEEENKKQINGQQPSQTNQSQVQTVANQSTPTNQRQVQTVANQSTPTNQGQVQTVANQSTPTNQGQVQTVANQSTPINQGQVQAPANQTAPTSQVQTQTKNDDNTNKEVKLEFTSKAIWNNGRWVDFNEIGNIHEFIETIKQNSDGNLKISFDLRGMNFISRALKNCIFSKEQVKQIKEFAYENRNNVEIIHGIFSKIGFKIKETIDKLQQQKLLKSNKNQDIKQIPQQAESLIKDTSVKQIPQQVEQQQENKSDKENFLDRIDARDVANQQANNTEQNVDNFETVLIDENDNSDEGR